LQRRRGGLAAAGEIDDRAADTGRTRGDDWRSTLERARTLKRPGALQRPGTLQRTCALKRTRSLERAITLKRAGAL
jgi:hypothetical protein